jgi:CDGSH-type Zn-finger protein
MLSDKNYLTRGDKIIPGAGMASNDGRKIRITRDGPYEVHGNIPLRNDIIGANERGESTEWRAGRTYDALDDPYCLCRCGHSRTKPFCDGSHEDAEFCGRESADKPPYEESAALIVGETIDLMDDENLCAGARFCDVEKTAWGFAQNSADPECRQKAIDEACNCPSGRLTAVDHDGRRIEPELEAGIGAIQDPEADARGPLWVRGGIPVEGPNGEAYETRNRVTLCRCGNSGNQPYCNGAHRLVPEMKGMDE